MRINIIKDLKGKVILCSFNEEKFNELKSLSDLAWKEFTEYEEKLKNYINTTLEELENKNIFFVYEYEKNNFIKKISKEFKNSHTFLYEKYLELQDFEQLELTE